MREVFADFARLQVRPELGLSVLLGREDCNLELAGLVEGEHIVLVEPGDLYAEGTAACVERDAYRYWIWHPGEHGRPPGRRADGIGTTK